MGSLNYIAPEILDGQGHSFEVDLFSIGIDFYNLTKVFFLIFHCLGILFYELVCGTLPYGDDENDPVKVYQTIMSMKVQFP